MFKGVNRPKIRHDNTLLSDPAKSEDGNIANTDRSQQEGQKKKKRRKRRKERKDKKNSKRKGSRRSKHRKVETMTDINEAVVDQFRQIVQSKDIGVS